MHPLGMYIHDMPSFAISAALLLIWLGGCSVGEQDGPLFAVDDRREIIVDFYRSVDECVRAARLDPKICMAGQAEANLRHSRYAEKWNAPDLCEEMHGQGSCDKAPPSHTGQRFWWARPAGFFVRYPDHGSGDELYFAPVYDRVDCCLTTGAGGGMIDRYPKDPTNPFRRRIRTRSIPMPVI